MPETATAVRETGIIMQPDSVRAILAGTKTQTRRVVVQKRNPHSEETQRWCASGGFPGGSAPVGSYLWMALGGDTGNRQTGSWARCPYGAPGDLLWVRETHAILDMRREILDYTRAPRPTEDCSVAVTYFADDSVRHTTCPPEEWRESFDSDHVIHRPSIHMPRWASRITLEITDVRVRAGAGDHPRRCVREGIESVGTCCAASPTVCLPSSVTTKGADERAWPRRIFQVAVELAQRRTRLRLGQRPVVLVPHLPPGGGLMRALSLWQPHATLCCLLRPEPNPFRLAEKPFETRGSWAERVPLGDVVIHAAKTTRRPRQHRYNGRPSSGCSGPRLHRRGNMPFGAALGVVEVVAVWRTTECGPVLVRRTGTAHRAGALTCRRTRCASATSRRVARCSISRTFAPSPPRSRCAGGRGCSRSPPTRKPPCARSSQPPEDRRAMTDTAEPARNRAPHRRPPQLRPARAGAGLPHRRGRPHQAAEEAQRRGLELHRHLQPPRGVERRRRRKPGRAGPAQRPAAGVRPHRAARARPHRRRRRAPD
jgi:hypothetical protein